MTTKKAIRGKHKSPGIKSAKRTGVVAQTIRIEAADNRLLHRVAKTAKQSFNSWAVDTLIEAAQAAIHKTEVQRAKKQAEKENAK